MQVAGEVQVLDQVKSKCMTSLGLAPAAKGVNNGGYKAWILRGVPRLSASQ